MEQSPNGWWGPVTATLDWCEANYQFSHYIAEVANTFSNLFTIWLALFGSVAVWRESLPERFLLGCAGFGLVGIGSFAFHATLLYEAQLADELPMVYVASFTLYLLLDSKPGFDNTTRRSILSVAALVAFDVLFTWSYYLYRNPVYHQVVFASILVLVIIRVTTCLRSPQAKTRIPDHKKTQITRLFTTGVLSFATGFLIWNLDNIFCGKLTSWKVSMGWPVAFLLEGHSWWHVLTGLGTHYKSIGIQYLILCMKDDHRHYIIGYKYGLPYVKRVLKKVQ
ncbi:alkaline ceramidase ydc1 [Pleurotus ostreatus]|uniref:Uncharacterized protein n=1 Tax=Pleurotus cornucopiae TaxID=5321 RepID=A0ACB7IW84_PLECO|nr:hypothetical protein CCMSSC00406_0002814 [Pleurotus cornucopiae]KAJ8702191.1 alkaline ceramidase ydc1 [Pleurotus ostreatus]